MDFEWNDAKAAGNLSKHQVPFEYAARAFLDPLRVDEPDERHEYGEDRCITMGKIEGRVFVVAYVMRGHSIRLISARKANEREQKRYHTFSA